MRFPRPVVGEERQGVTVRKADWSSAAYHGRYGQIAGVSSHIKPCHRCTHLVRNAPTSLNSCAHHRSSNRTFWVPCVASNSGTIYPTPSKASLFSQREKFPDADGYFIRGSPYCHPNPGGIYHGWFLPKQKQFPLGGFLTQGHRLYIRW